MVQQRRNAQTHQGNLLTQFGSCRLFICSNKVASLRSSSHIVSASEDMGGENAWTEMEVFDDFLLVMARKLGEQALMEELCKGFHLLADPQTQTITLRSLKKSEKLLGVEEMTDNELQAMIVEGDVDGDGALNEIKFCILMLRLSPSLMAEAQQWLEDALAQELESFMEEAY